MDFLAFDQAGPVAILLLVLVGLAKVTHWLLVRILDDKDEQITILRTSNERLAGEIGQTLATILQTLKDQAEERRRSR